jgi:hypothetical protein
MIRLAPATNPAMLTSGRGDSPPRAAIDPSLGQTQLMLAHDQEYLYIAAICHRPSPPTSRQPTTASPRRKRDQLDAEVDQLQFALDLDRDCRTSYFFAVDALGSFAEQIGEDRLWNPTWYVAHSSAELNWIVEAAIPLDQLGPNPSDRFESAWGISIRRSLPDGTTERWSPSPGAGDPRLDTRLTKPGFASFDGIIRVR